MPWWIKAYDLCNIRVQRLGECDLAGYVTYYLLTGKAQEHYPVNFWRHIFFSLFRAVINAVVWRKGGWHHRVKSMPPAALFPRRTTSCQRNLLKYAIKPQKLWQYTRMSSIFGFLFSVSLLPTSWDPARDLRATRVFWHAWQLPRSLLFVPAIKRERNGLEDDKTEVSSSYSTGV